MISKETQECFLCSSAGNAACEFCNLVVACCADHLGRHRTPGGRCLPFRIRQDPIKGRCVVATRDIEPLELVIEDVAAGLGPKQLTLPVCLVCLLPLKACEVFPCPSCNYPMCSPECAADSRHTNKECKVFPRFPDMLDYDIEQPQYECIVPLRLVLTKEQDPSLWSIVSLHGDHSNDRRRVNPQLIQEESSKITGLLLQFCSLAKSGYTEADISFVSSLVATHCVVVGERGRGFYPLFAFMSHSCTYNARHVIDEHNTIRVYAQTSIAKDEEVTITYTSLLSSTSSRQQKLSNLWFFTCTCARCSDPTELNTFVSSVTCPDCPRKGYLVLHNSGDWRCTECAMVVPDAMVTNLLDSTRSKMGGTSDPVQLHQQFLRETSQLLHPNNYQVLITERILSQLYCPTDDPAKHTREDVLAKLKFSKHLLSVIEILDAGFSQFRGLTLFQLFRAKYLLSLADHGTIADLNPGEVEKLADILETCVKCLSVEPPQSQAGRVAKKAKMYLDNLKGLIVKET